MKLHIESAKQIVLNALTAGCSDDSQMSIAKAVDNSATLSILLREFNHDLVSVLTHANIPLGKVENENDVNMMRVCYYTQWHFVYV